MADLSDLRRRIDRRIEGAIRNAANDLRRNLIAGAPRKSNRLALSISVDAAPKGATARIDVPYATFVTEGTRPHEILGHPLLSFFWPKVGRRMFLRRIKLHPGNDPNPWYANAIRRWPEFLQRALDRA